VLLDENFNYAAGTLLTANGWAAHSGAGTNAIAVTSSGLSYSGYPSSAFGNAAAMTVSGEDDNRSFAPAVTSGSAYCAFMVNVSAATVAGDYFFHLGTSPFSTSAQAGRVFCRSAAGGVNFGISKLSSTVVWSSSVFPLNQTHLVVVKYNFILGLVNDTVDLFVDPNSCPVEPLPLVTSGTETTTDPSSLACVALRQGGSSSGSTQWVDGIRVGMSWSEVVCGVLVGACCFPNGSCSVLDAVACANQSGTYAGDGTNCTTYNCPQPTGACCAPDGACAMTTQAACALPSIWHSDWTACLPNNPCPQLGACCAPVSSGGACSVTFEVDCVGTWTLHEDCDPDPCPKPQGSCCEQSGACTVTAQLPCAAIGGIWTLDGVCEPINPCEQPTGACCFPTGVCTVTFQLSCLAEGGVYVGDGTTCGPTTCPQPDGSCCVLEGTCTVTKLADCPTGTWTMFADCEPNDCVQPDGSCCAPIGTCTVTKAIACTGVWTMFGVCEPNNPCPQPNGSCCLLDGSCTVTLHTECTTGTWTAFGVCFPNTCLQPTGACCVPDGSCLLGTIDDCATVVGGVYQGNGTNCTPNLCPAPLRTLCEVAEDDPVTGVPLLMGQRVTVEGIAITNRRNWSTTIPEFQMTDGNCCVTVFGGTWPPNPEVQIGDRVRVTGKVTHYNGKTEITTPDLTVTVLSGGNPVPAPGVTTTGNLAAAGEPFESCLFTIHCASIISGTWPAAGSDANIVINDGTGLVTMRIDKDTDVDGSPAPVGPFTITGIGDQFDTSSPYTTGWQIKPRFLADLAFDCATGACCFLSGDCVVLDEVVCAAQGGTYSGNGSTCTPNDCPPPVGACCFLTGVCEILTQAACPPPALWLGFGSVCLPNNPCEQPTGSCCFPDGTCILMPQAPCTGGIWTMFAVCEPINPCELPPVYGSCCYPDGSCDVTTQANCTATWLANGGCNPNICEQPPAQGACCDTATGACTITTQALCLPPLVWRGANVPCNAETCAPPVPTERTSWGQIKNLYR
jgi:hypothetical protein